MTEKEINEQGKAFLSKLAPLPESPASRRKKEPADTNLTERERTFVRKYLGDSSALEIVSNKQSKQVLINAAIHDRLKRYTVKISGGSGKLTTIVNNVLAEFIEQNIDLLESTFAKFNNDKF